MVDNASLNMPIKPSFDVQAFNVILSQLKAGLGTFGKNIKLIDENEYKAQLAKLGATVENELPESFDKAAKKSNEKVKQGFAGLSGMVARAFNFQAIAGSVQILTQAINQLSEPFIKFEAGLADLSAITGVSGKQLEMFGESAKKLASEFGGTATSQIEAFKGILSRLGPDIAKSPEALDKMARAINTVSAASGLDATTSMDALTTSMLQFNVSLDDPIAASEVMTSMMNVLAAGAKEGASEIPQVADAIKVAGVAAYGANLSFEEVNSAIQVMAAGGKYGAEAGTALRNVIGLLQKASGPAEQAMAKMGTSSKELGKIITTQGLSAAIKELKDGMNNLGSDAEKNAALMEIFGTENAAAAGILIQRVDQMDGLTAKITGTQTAFEQAKVNMDTTQSALGRFKADVENALIGVFQKLGGGIAGLAQNITTVLPLITALAGIKTIFPPGLSAGISKLSVTLITSLFPALAGTTLSFGAVAAAVWAALAPLLPFIAIAAALGVGLYALAGGFNKSTESKIKDAEASVKLTDKQIEIQKQNIKTAESTATLAAAWERLGLISQQRTLAPDELKTYNDLTLELTKRMPGAIKGGEDFQSNLARVKDQLAENNAKIDDYQKTIDKLAIQKEQQILVKVKLDANKAREDINATLKDAISGFTDAETFGQGNFMMRLVDRIRTAANSEELAKAQQELQEKLWTSNFDDETKNKITDQAQALADAQTAIFDQKNKIEEVKQKQRIDKFIADIKQQTANGAFSIGPYTNKDDQTRAETAINTLAVKWGLTKDEARKVIEEQKKMTEEANKTAEAAAKISVNYGEVLAKLKEQRDKGIEQEQNYDKAYRDASARGDKVAAEEAKRKRDEQARQNKENDKQYDKEKKAGDDITKKYEEQKKSGKSAFEIAKQKYEIEKRTNQLEFEKTDVMTNNLAVAEKRNLTDAENLNIAQKKTETLKKDLAFMIEQFGIIQEADGSISVKPQFSKNKLDIEEMLLKLQGDITNSEKALIKIKPKLDPVELSEQLKADIERTELEIELGITLPAGIEPLINQYVNALQSELTELESKLQAEADEAERQKLQEKINKKKMDILNAEKDIRERKKAEYEKQLADLEEANAKELAAKQKEIDAIRALQDKLTELGEKSAGNKETDRYNNESKNLENMKKNEVISEEFYNKEKERLEREHGARMAALQAAANGAKLAAERNQALEMLRIKEAQAAKELELAQKSGDQKLIDEKLLIFDEVRKDIKEKGDIFAELGAQLEGGLADTMTPFFAGDTQGMKDAAKGTFATMAGILKKEAALALTRLIINYLWDPSNPLPWYAKLLAIPAITVLINSAINAIVDPLLGSMASFSTGGRVDSPSVVMVGDASKSRPGPDTEWIFRDDQIAALINESLYRQRMTDITINEMYRKNNEAMILDMMDEYMNQIKAVLTINTPDSAIPEGYNPDLAEMTLNNPMVNNIVNEASGLSTSGIEARLDSLIDKFDSFEGRIHVVESEIGIAANRYNNAQKRRSIV